MAVLRELHHDRTFLLRSKVSVIGRDPTCDVTIPLRQVSGRHAMVVRLSGHHYIEDLNSRNGTSVNGERIKQRTRLSPGDQIEVGGRTLAYEADIEEPSMEQTLRGTGRPIPEQPSLLSSLAASGDLHVARAPEAKLRAILEICKHLGASLDLKVVLPRVLESLFVTFPQADRGFILLRDPGTGQLAVKAERRRNHSAQAASFSQTVVDYALHSKLALLSADARADERFAPSESIRQLQISSVMCVPLLSQEGTGLGVIQLDSLARRHQFQQEDLDVLVSAGSQAARAVELAHLHQELHDLEAATQIQKSFLPAERPQVAGLQFFDYYAPARQVGGDYFDYIPLPGNRLAVALGDVSGKGVPAALLMARLSAAARFCLATNASVPEAVRQLSVLLTRAGTEDRFVTFVVAVVDLGTLSITLVNAGHMPPLRRGAPGSKAEDVAEEIGGLPLAVLDRPYEEVVMPLRLGETFVLYTDGVTEARNTEGGFYGIDRLRMVTERAADDAEAIGRAILTDVQRFVGERPPSDDLTLVCFRRHC